MRSMVLLLCSLSLWLVTGARGEARETRSLPVVLVQLTEPQGVGPSRETALLDSEEAALKAEMEKRWNDAERLYEELLAKAPDRVDLLLRLADVYAADKKPLDAAQADSRAADQRRTDVRLQIRTSEAFAAANRPNEALEYTDRALAIQPDNLGLHERRARLATWAGAYGEAEESLRILLAAHPGEIVLKRDLGRVLGWEGWSDDAADLLSIYLSVKPNDKEALLEFARVQTARGDTAAALDLYNRYLAAGGDELTYRRGVAMTLASGGRSYEALALANAGLATNPDDFSFRFARATALNNGYMTGLAHAEAEQLSQARPSAKEVNDLLRTIDIPRLPYLQSDINLRQESDHILAAATEISFHQPINDTWWLFAGGRSDFLTAPRSSGFSPIEGGDFIARGASWVGVQMQYDFGALASAQVGETGTGLGGPKTIWKVGLDDQLSDTLRLQALNSRDYETVSPRSLSLGITRIDTQAQATVTPDPVWTIAMLGQETEFSDGNRALHGILGPRREIFRTQYLDVDLGVSGEVEGYRFTTTEQDGYYSPLFFQQYLTDLYFYYKMNNDDGAGLVISLGALKDNTMPTFKLANDYTLEVTLGRLKKWTWKFHAAYTNNGSSLGPGFSAVNFGATLIRRF